MRGELRPHPEYAGYFQRVEPSQFHDSRQSIDRGVWSAEGIRLSPEAVRFLDHPEDFPEGSTLRTCETRRPWCNGVFVARKPWARFCGSPCRQWAYRERNGGNAPVQGWYA